MKAEEPPTRREALRLGALGAGVVWAAPIARRTQLSGTSGSPPPTSTASTTIPPSVVALSGAFVASGSATNPPLGCAVLAEFETDPFDLGQLGDGALALEACFDGVFNVSEGTFTLTTSDGSLSGTIPDGKVTVQAELPLPFVFTLDVTGGTGSLAGATGTIMLEGGIADFASTAWHGNLAGTIEIPNP